MSALVELLVARRVSPASLRRVRWLLVARANLAHCGSLKEVARQVFDCITLYRPLPIVFRLERTMMTSGTESGVTSSLEAPPIEGGTVANQDPSSNPDDSTELSKKAVKRAAKQASKDARKEAAALQVETANKRVDREGLELHPAADFTFGGLKLIQSSKRTDRKWTRLADLDESLVGSEVWIRARVHIVRCKGALAFLRLREQLFSIQAVIDSRIKSLGRNAVKWVGTIPVESVVDVCGFVSKPTRPVNSCSLSTIELSVSKLFIVSRASPELPFQLRDAERSDKELAEEGAIAVGQDTRLDTRILDLRTATNQAIFRIQAAVGSYFREAFRGHGFTEIHTPKLIAGAAEGGASVFTLDYFGRKACLAQSPQLHKQMAICADFGRVFEICPVFRAENSNTYRHLCEFVGVDAEMTIYEHYDEILELLQCIFVSIFEQLTRKEAAEIEVVRTQYGGDPLVWLPAEQTPRIEFKSGIAMLCEEGIVAKDAELLDLSTEQERALGAIIKKKYNTDFFVLYNYPLAARPFYTMPNADNDGGSNSYDFFLRGEEILSGAQRIHDRELLKERAAAMGVPLESIQAYVDSFNFGVSPHGGCGIGLERVVMLFLGLNNVRKASLFPRDPKRLSP